MYDTMYISLQFEKEFKWNAGGFVLSKFLMYFND